VQAAKFNLQDAKCDFSAITGTKIT